MSCVFITYTSWSQGLNFNLQKFDYNLKTDL